MERALVFALTAGLIASIGTPAHAQLENVGSITFPTSASGQAQQHFLRGVAILHSFGWEQAQEQFQLAQQADPDFAMAYWGESLAYNHPLFSGMDPTEPRNVLNRLAPTRAERLANAPTDREKGFVNAVEILWGDGELAGRRLGYMEAMAELHAEYPEDPEVAAFYSLSILSARSAAGGDPDGRMAIRAGTIALDLFNANENHPGAAHYTIHAFDDPVHAPLALEAAYRFAEIAPAVSHARHMPTHIFIQHGMWDRVSWNNQYAYAAARDLWQPGQSMGDAIHALDWGQYGDLQMGDYEKARLWIERIESMSGEGGFLEGGARGSGGAARAVNTVPLTKARYVVETEEWMVEPVTEESNTNTLLATAMSAAHLGDASTLAAAETELKRRVDADDGGNELVLKEVSALLHAGMGHLDYAAEIMDEAVAIVEARRPPNGAASPIKPVHELYGEILLDGGRAEDAIGNFETSLLRMPRRSRSLLGLARAHAAAGNQAEAAEAYEELLRVWEGRDFDGVHEARSFLTTTTSDRR